MSKYHLGKKLAQGHVSVRRWTDPNLEAEAIRLAAIPDEEERAISIEKLLRQMRLSYELLLDEQYVRRAQHVQEPKPGMTWEEATEVAVAEVHRALTLRSE